MSVFNHVDVDVSDANVRSTAKYRLWDDSQLMSNTPLNEERLCCCSPADPGAVHWLIA